MLDYSEVIVPSILLNVVAINKENKNYFIPPKSKIKKLIVGDSVQINNGEERFWVKIIAIKKVKGGTLFVGSVVNKLLKPDEYDLGSKIYFADKNILNVYDEDYIQWVKQKKFSTSIGLIDSEVNEKK